VPFNIAHRIAPSASVWDARQFCGFQSTFGCLRTLFRGRGSSLLANLCLRTISTSLLLGSLALLLPVISAQEGGAAEYRAKATFLAAFPNFIEWPADAFSSPQAPVLICVFGDFSFGTSLTETTRGASIRDHQVEVRWVHREQDLRACHVLFVSHSEEKHYGRIFKAIQGASVLTVGETQDFLSSGGAIDFLITDGRLQFDVNMRAANDARLRISSNMLALAKHIVTKAEAAKS